MGWTCEALPTEGWRLYTRGGTEGVFVQKMDEKGNPESEEVRIPSELLRKLVAEDVRSKKIEVIEQSEDDEILGLS